MKNREARFPEGEVIPALDLKHLLDYLGIPEGQF